MNNHILTWEVLCRKGWQGPGFCILCKGASETSTHVFLHCTFTTHLWLSICSALNVEWTWNQNTLHECHKNWVQSHRDHPTLPLFICWGVWLHRNRALFDDDHISPFITGLKILTIYREYRRQPSILKKRRLIQPFIYDFQLVGYFDGATKDGVGGCGFVLYLNENHYYRGWMGLVTGTNNLAELSAIWALLYWAHYLNINSVNIYGDSLLIINWLIGKNRIVAATLHQRCTRIRELISQMGHVQFKHI